MIKVAICDDDLIVAQQIESAILNFDKYKSQLEVDVFTSAVELLTFCQKEDYMFFFLDIEMPSMMGIELARSIRERGNHSPIVFVTSFSEYMEEVFHLHTFDYLLKPVSEKDVQHVVDKLMSYLNMSSNRFVFEYNRSTYSLLYAEIIYIEKQSRQALIHTKTDTYKVNLSSDEIISRLDQNFIRAHNSFIINAVHITEFNSKYLKLSQDIVIPIGRKYSKDVKSFIVEMMRKTMG